RSPLQPSCRLNAEVETSAARKEIASSPIALAARTVFIKSKQFSLCTTLLAVILKDGLIFFIAPTPKEIFSNPRGIFLMRSCTSLLPSREMITSLRFATISGAYFSSNRPVERITTRILLSRSTLQKFHRLECIRASPPDRTTSRTPSRSKASEFLCNHSVDNSFFSWLAFQMSHITQRQLQRLCGISTRTGMS